MFTVDGLDNHLALASLSAKHGTAVRAGRIRAHPLVGTVLEKGSDTYRHLATASLATRASLTRAWSPSVRSVSCAAYAVARPVPVMVAAASDPLSTVRTTRDRSR